MIADKIQEYLANKDKTINEAILEEIKTIASATFKRQFMVEKENSKDLRMSSAGKCARQLAYKYHSFPESGKELDARAKIIFWTGDLTELTIVSLARISGATVIGTGLSQTTCQLNFGEKTIYGHPDGIIIDPETRKFLLLEVKSMASYAFERFEKGEIDQGYLCQINLYLKALGLEKAVIVALNKDAGVLSERILDFDPVIAAWAENNIQTVLDSTAENLPARPFTPDGKGILPWNCLYCAYHKTCWPGAEKVLISKSYKLQVKKKEAINA